MDFHHPHNLVDPTAATADRRWGIRVTLPPGDTMQKVLGDDWERLLWYPSKAARDQAFDRMAIRHGYYRASDTPTQVLEKLERG